MRGVTSALALLLALQLAGPGARADSSCGGGRYYSADTYGCVETEAGMYSTAAMAQSDHRGCAAGSWSAAAASACTLCAVVRVQRALRRARHSRLTAAPPSAAPLSPSLLAGRVDGGLNPVRVVRAVRG